MADDRGADKGEIVSVTTPTTIEGRIYDALVAHLQDNSGSWVVAYPNMAFTPPDNRIFLEVRHSPNMVGRMTIESDGPHRYFGIFQISVHGPLDIGSSADQEKAGIIATWFPADTKMKNGDLVVRVMGDPTVAESMPIKDDLVTPVSVEYETYY